MVREQQMGKQRGTRGLTQIGDLVSPKLLNTIKGPSAIKKRLVEAAAAQIERPDDPRKLLYQHTVFCQTALPYRDAGDDTRIWERSNGDVHLMVKAGHAMHPEERRLVPIGLPFGPKCRLVLMYINQLALIQKTPHIEAEDSLTAFVRRVMKLDPMGRNIRMVKEQLARLACSDITLGTINDDPAGTNASTDQVHIIRHFNVWFPKDERQRVLWPSTIDLSLDYFESLMNHAVPLDEAHIAALSHSGMALDIYSWLAQRLHRIPLNKPAFISWTALHGQFGQGYTGDQAVKKFRSIFRVALKEVLSVYRTARIDDEELGRPRLYAQGQPLKAVWRNKPATGLRLHNSPPPVPKRLQIICGKP
jgi:replication initiator protein